jgi:ribose transport system substrate-binding protein
MNKAMLKMAGVALAALLAAGPGWAQKKTLAVVVKGLDNPFFTVLGDGCALWNKENPQSEYTCLYTGPASSADEAGEVQIVEDLINKGVAGIAISPSNAPAMANMLKTKQPKMPIMTIDADLASADRALRKTYLGTNNYDMGSSSPRAAPCACSWATSRPTTSTPARPASATPSPARRAPTS